MNFKDAWRVLFANQTEKKNEITDPLRTPMSLLLGMDAAHWTEAKYQELAREAYLRNVIAYKCIKMTADAIGSLKWYVCDKSEKEVENHPLITLLKRPNPSQGGSAFFAQAASSKQLCGNAYVQAVRPSPGRAPRELWVLYPDGVTITRGFQRLPTSYSYSSLNGNGPALSFPVDPVTGKCDLLHVKNYNPLDEFIGASPLQPAAMSVDLHNEGGEWNKKLLENGARPSGALTSESMLSAEQLEDLRKVLHDRYQGSANAGAPMVLGGGLKWESMSLSPKDMEFLQAKHSSARDIALALGVPPLLLGIPGDATFNNQREARLAYYEDTVLPEANAFRDELNRWLVPMFDPSLTLMYDEDCITALSPRREQLWDRVQQATFLSVNEKREMLGFEPVEGGDTVPGSSPSEPESVEEETFNPEEQGEETTEP